MLERKNLRRQHSDVSQKQVSRGILHFLSTQGAPEILQTGNMERKNPKTYASGTLRSLPVDKAATAGLLERLKTFCQ